MQINSQFEIKWNSFSSVELALHLLGALFSCILLYKSMRHFRKSKISMQQKLRISDSCSVLVTGIMMCINGIFYREPKVRVCDVVGVLSSLTGIKNALHTTILHSSLVIGAIYASLFLIAVIFSQLVIDLFDLTRLHPPIHVITR